MWDRARHAVDRIPATLGRRGAVLLALGIAWVARGVTILHDPGLHVPDHAIIHNLLPPAFRLTLWVSTGVVAVATAWCNRAQGVGWAALILLPAERIGSHAWSVAMWAVPGPPTGTPYSIAYAVYWLALIVVILAILAISRWREDSEARLAKSRHDRGE